MPLVNSYNSPTVQKDADAFSFIINVGNDVFWHFSWQIGKLALILQVDREVFIFWRGDATTGCFETSHHDTHERQHELPHEDKNVVADAYFP